MPTTRDTPTRVAADLMAAAAIEGARQGRSATQQLDYCARVGRAVCAEQSPARRRVEAALAGTLALSGLSGEEAAIFTAQMQTRIEQGQRATNLGAVLNASGIATVSLDGSGQMIEHRPDGSHAPLAAKST